MLAAAFILACLLTVSAEEKITGVAQRIEVRPSYGLSHDDMADMLYDSLDHAEDDMVRRLLTEARVATIPLSPFYAQPQRLPFVRLCVAKRDSTLDEAAARLNAFAAGAARL